MQKLYLLIASHSDGSSVKYDTLISSKLAKLYARQFDMDFYNVVNVLIILHGHNRAGCLLSANGNSRSMIKVSK